MAKIYLAPLCAVRYIGEEPRQCVQSIARPKPMVEYGDIVVMEKRDAFNVARLLPNRYELIDSPSIELESNEEDLLDIEELISKEEFDQMVAEMEELQAANEELENQYIKQEVSHQC